MGFSYNVNVLNQKGSPAIYTDTFANRPAFGFAGRLFIANDTAAIYEDTGTAWVLIANVSSGAGTLQQVTTNGNTSNVGISVTAGGVSTNSATITSLTQGSVPFVGAAGLITQDNANLFFDDTNNRLGINTNTPSNNLDVHGTGTTALLALNNTSSNQSLISFLKNSSAKWRIGNSSTDTFDILNVGLTTNAISISNASNCVSFLANLLLKQSTGFQSVASFNGIACDAGGFFFQLGTSNNVAYLNFIGLTAARTFTFPDAAGTLALTTDLSSYLPLTGGNLTGNITVSVNTGLSALTLNNASLSGKNWSFINTTSGADTDLSLFYSGTSGGTKVTFGNTGNASFTATGGRFDIDLNGQIISKQNLDVATAGGRFTGQSARGTMGNIQIDQVTTGADGGQIKFSTCPSGSTTPTLGMTLSSSQNLLINSTTDDTVNKLQVTGSFKTTGSISYGGIRQSSASSGALDAGTVNLSTLMPNITFNGNFISMQLQIVSTDGGSVNSSIINCARTSGTTWTSSLVNTVGTANLITLTFGGTSASPTLALSGTSLNLFSVLLCCIS